ncbi:MAG TPA: LytR C-terminal domain-containing protein [Clostridiales bacterium]|nr:LytR C-terminal domain-containing protein [Clostridiales bacterium]HQP69593.1 LytR C-terminal domain-containing protein [Clostridiales bacterium]
MPRFKLKKERKESVKENNIHLWIIISLLFFQTIFLLYKNIDFFKDKFAVDPNALYEDEIVKKQTGSTVSEADYPKVSLKDVRISILNGCGASGIASLWKEKLRGIGLDVRETGNTDKRYAKSVILSRTEDMKYAKQLAKRLGVGSENVVMQLNKDLVDIDLTLIVGSDHKELEKR